MIYNIIIKGNKEDKKMYRFNVYETFVNGDFRLLTTYACYGDTREDAKVKAQKWAEATYPTRKVNVMSTN